MFTGLEQLVECLKVPQESHHDFSPGYGLAQAFIEAYGQFLQIRRDGRLTDIDSHSHYGGAEIRFAPAGFEKNP